MLALPRQPRLAWHLARLAEEQIEVQSTRPFTVARLSERADVHFAIVRARYDGFCVAAVPPLGWPAVYMLGKYTSRWAYYGLVGWLCGGRGVREVVNPGKDAKLRSVAERHVSGCVFAIWSRDLLAVVVGEIGFGEILV